MDVSVTHVASHVLNEHLIPDLASIVIDYCWIPDSEYIVHSIVYGNYEKAQTYISKWIWSWTILCVKVTRSGYVKIAKLMIERIEKTHDEICWSPATIFGVRSLNWLVYGYMKK